MEIVHNKLYNLTLTNHIHLLDEAVTVMYLKCMLQAIVIVSTLNS